MELVERLRAVTSVQDLWDTDLDEALCAQDSADALPAVLALLERYIPVVDDDDRICLVELVEYVERCGANEDCDRAAISAAIAASLGRTPCVDLLDLFLTIAAPTPAAAALVRILETRPVEPRPRRLLSCALAELAEAHHATFGQDLKAAIDDALSDAFEPVISWSATPGDLCTAFRRQRHIPADGEFYQEELWLNGGGFTYTDRWVGCHDATRDTRRGTWRVWLTAPGRSAREEFVERFGPRRIAPHRVEPFPGHDATDALVERIAQTSEYQETHMDPQDGDVDEGRRVRAGPGVLMRVYVHRESGALALDGGSGLLEQYDDDDDDWLY